MAEAFPVHKPFFTFFPLTLSNNVFHKAHIPVHQYAMACDVDHPFYYDGAELQVQGQTVSEHVII